MCVNYTTPVPIGLQVDKIDKYNFRLPIAEETCLYNLENFFHLDKLIEI